MFNRCYPDYKSLFNYLQWTDEYYFSLYRVNKPATYKDITLTTYILENKKVDL